MNHVQSLLYRKVVKPFFFALPPDVVHARVVQALYGISKVPGMLRIQRRLTTKLHPELACTYAGIHFNSPLGLSAGLDKNGQTVAAMQAFGFGFSEVGSVTAEPCAGNEKPWFYRLPKSRSLVVHVGLANQGVKRVIARLEKNPTSVQQGFPTVLSIARTNSQQASSVEAGIADYVSSAKAAQKSPAIQLIELNISCPNAYCGEAFTNPQLLELLLREIDALKLTKPVFIKMPHDLPWTALRKLLDIALRHRVTGVTLTNLVKDRSQVSLRDPLPDSVLGGLSGEPTRARSTELITKTYAYCGEKLIIMGVGGIFSAEDAYEKIKAGASMVGMVTGLIFEGPTVVEAINAGLVRFVRRDGFASIRDAVGVDVYTKSTNGGN